MTTFQRIVVLVLAVFVAKLSLPMFGFAIAWTQATTLVILLYTIAVVWSIGGVSDEENIKVIVMQAENKEEGGD